MDNFGRTALHLALLGGHGEVVELLLNKGGTVNEEPNIMFLLEFLER